MVVVSASQASYTLQSSEMYIPAWVFVRVSKHYVAGRAYGLPVNVRLLPDRAALEALQAEPRLSTLQDLTLKLHQHHRFLLP